MRQTIIAVLEAAAVAASLSIDAFAAGFAYGSNKIEIPMRSVQVVNIICGAVTGASLLAGTIIAPVLPRGLTLAAAFVILFVIGLTKLLDSLTKSTIRKHSGINKQFKASIFNVKFILHMYADPESADMDASQTITSTEAAALALSLSLDGIAVGFGAALMSINAVAVVVCSLVTNAAAMVLGSFFGKKAAQKAGFNISWLGGALLIGLAFLKLL